MALKIRDALDELPDEALRRLCVLRGVPLGRSMSTRCSALARSYRGGFEQLIVDLRREDLVKVLSASWLAEDGRDFTYNYLGRGTREQLESLVRLHFIDDWEPDESGPTPVIGAPFEVIIEEEEEEDDGLQDGVREGAEDEELEEEELTEEEFFASPRYRTEQHANWFWSELRYSLEHAHEPRDYQKAAINRALEELDPEQPKMLHVATGGGKTFIANDILMRRLGSRGGWALWVTKDWRLLFQAARDLARRYEGLASKLRRVGGGHSILNPLPDSNSGRVVYTTLHTMRKRLKAISRTRGNPSLIVWDECHWAESGTLGRTLLNWAEDMSIPVLGLTATPRHEDESRFEVVFRMDFATLVDRGHLAQPVLTDPVKTEIEWRSARRGGSRFDFTGDSLRELALNHKRNSFIVKHYVKNQSRYGKTIVFACNIQHANELARLFKGQGIPARPIHSHLAEGEGEGALQQFERGEIRVLTNVAMLTHGVDIPDAQTVFLCRPTLSEILYSQMVGRASRLHVPTGKIYFNIVEFVDLSAFREQLVTAKEFFAGAGGFVSGTERLTTPAQSMRFRKLRKRHQHRFDPKGAPTWIPERADVPEAMRGLWYRQDQTFGLEFEFTRDDFNDDMSDSQWSSVAEPLRMMLAEVLPPGAVSEALLTEYTGSEGKSHDVWHIERDGSCGWEVTSRILSNEAGFREVVVACEALQRAVHELELKVNFRTGFHIHLGWIGKSVAEIKRAIVLAKCFEPALATLVAPSRLAAFDGQSYDLGNPNRFCKPVSVVFPMRKLEEASRIDDLLGSVAEYDARYVTFNVRPLSDIQTVEVRMHSGTFEASKALLWLSLWMQILWAAAERPLAPAPPDVDVITPNGDILQLARQYLPAVQQPLFLKRLDARRREAVQLWKRSPQLRQWVDFAWKWGAPL